VCVCVCVCVCACKEHKTELTRHSVPAGVHTEGGGDRISDCSLSSNFSVDSDNNDFFESSPFASNGDQRAQSFSQHYCGGEDARENPKEVHHVTEENDAAMLQVRHESADTPTARCNKRYNKHRLKSLLSNTLSQFLKSATKRLGFYFFHPRFPPKNPPVQLALFVIGYSESLNILAS